MSASPPAEFLQRLWSVSSQPSERPSGKVWKDECAFTFDTPTSEYGLFVNLNTFQSFGLNAVALDRSRTGCSIYLQIKHVVEKSDEEEKKVSEDAAPTKLAIGMEGGFNAGVPSEQIVAKLHRLVLWEDIENGNVTSDSFGLSFPCEWELPPGVRASADFVIRADDASRKAEVASWSAENEPRKVSKYAKDLPQVDNGVKISPDPLTWKCEDSGLTENLWLNLSTGYIGSGRKNWDGTGGTGAALKHFENTGSIYPLCVKLGTITAKGEADVYSYALDENDMVSDPWLKEHLAHFGINISQLSKTERTIAEMEVDLNAKYDWSKVCEEGKELVPVNGPGFVGLKNLGNSCYMNTVFQVIFSLAEMKSRYGDESKSLKDAFKGACSTPQEDLGVQLTKFGRAIYDKDAATKGSISPRLLKYAAAGNNSDFKGGEQQDAAEYFRHVLESLAREEHKRKEKQPFQKLFMFASEERTQCVSSNTVKYAREVHSMLQLTVSTEDAVQEAPDAKRAKTEGKEESSERLTVPFSSCLSRSLGPEGAEEVKDYLSPATGVKGLALKSTFMATFPKYLAVQLRRYVVGADWRPVKLDCLVPVPEKLDLSKFKGQGLRPGEVEMPEAAAVVPEADAAIVSQLSEMGFPVNGCKRAALATGNSGVQEAMEWCFAHSQDPDFDSPPEANAGATGAKGNKEVDPAVMQMLCGLGFGKDAVELAVSSCNGDAQRAADWLFSHMDELPALVAAASSASSEEPSEGDTKMEDNDGPGSYTLRAMISHLGKNTSCGHYVCHIKKNEKWHIFNDEKVAVSETPPFDLAYIYIFERDEQ